ncbi:hypothetical protein Moror_16707 [Moniliophthora roreri MCA 2997]|uniref:DUF6589 domain-containing protein n=1 Tax=Moniliophthora roreri (strain MCA 2997) TaxID=1381753 RepID=V2WMB0_MONRO|nr:hypothetical protein Moror_16707 [Moniliophthora roreri MCA 2997]
MSDNHFYFIFFESFSRLLQCSVIDWDFVLNYSLGQLHTELEESALFTMQPLSALSTSPHQGTEYQLLAVRLKKALSSLQTITATAASCLGEFSWNNNAYRKLFGIYLYGTGTRCQPFTVIYSLGLTESYTHLVCKPAVLTQITGSSVSPDDTMTKSLSGNNLLPTQPPTEAHPTMEPLLKTSHVSHGVQNQALSTESMPGAKGALSEAKPSLLQGHKDTQENGTCATIWPLHNTTIENLDLEVFKAVFNKAEPLQLTNILHSPDETSQFCQCLVHTILHIIVNHGGEGFAQFQDNLEHIMLKTEEKLVEHITEVYPLPSWPIDESKITGADHVDAAIVDELKLKESLNWIRSLQVTSFPLHIGVPLQHCEPDRRLEMKPLIGVHG